MSSPEENQLEKKINVILEAVQNFGLNFIQKIGELNHTVSILTDQVEKMNSALMSIKGLEPSIAQIASMKNDLLSEIQLLQSQIKATSFKNSEIIKMKNDSKYTESIDLLDDFRKKLPSFKEITSLTQELEEAKKKVYEITGGHRVLFEIGETLNQIRKLESISELDIQKFDEKITFWLNKLKN